MEMEQGYKKLQAQFEIDYGKLKSNHERECLELKSRKGFLEVAKTDLAQGFET